MFSSDITVSCVTIEIFNDSLIENDEIFNVAPVLEVNQTFTMLGNNSFATVTILDSDGGRSENPSDILLLNVLVLINPHSIKDLMLSLEQAAYTVMESAPSQGGFDVCVIITNGPGLVPQKEVTVTVSATSDSVEGT